VLSECSLNLSEIARKRRKQARVSSERKTQDDDETRRRRREKRKEKRSEGEVTQVARFATANCEYSMLKHPGARRSDRES
jgi:hypothetical protein